MFGNSVKDPLILTIIFVYLIYKMLQFFWYLKNSISWDKHFASFLCNCYQRYKTIISRESLDCFARTGLIKLFIKYMYIILGMFIGLYCYMKIEVRQWSITPYLLIDQQCILQPMNLILFSASTIPLRKQNYSIFNNRWFIASKINVCNFLHNYNLILFKVQYMK